jgi:hypothetical protein
MSQLITPGRYFDIQYFGDWNTPRPRIVDQYNDKEIIFYGNRNLHNRIYSTADMGDTWQTHTTVLSTDFTNEFGSIITVIGKTRSGRLVASTDASGTSGVGHIIQTEIDGVTWQENPVVSFGMPGGYVEEMYGYSIFEDVVIVGSYGPVASKCDEVWATFNGGDNWYKIGSGFLGESEGHIHDVEFDPYSGRIYAALEHRQYVAPDGAGDWELKHRGSPVDRIMYTDNWGNTWNDVSTTPGRIFGPLSTTAIIALQSGVFFGSDGRPDGVSAWFRDTNRPLKPMFDKDIILGYVPIGVEGFNSFRHIAFKPSITRHPQLNLCILPFAHESSFDNDKAVIRHLATTDGVEWHTVWSHPRAFNAKGGTQNPIGFRLAGPHPKDNDRQILGMASGVLGAYAHGARFKMPEIL